MTARIKIKTEEELKKVKEFKELGLTYRQIGKILDISVPTISRIVKSDFDLTLYRETLRVRVAKERGSEEENHPEEILRPQVEHILEKMLLIMQNTHVVLLEIQDELEKNNKGRGLFGR
jgi:predicted transcriptional regulator